MEQENLNDNVFNVLPRSKFYWLAWFIVWIVYPAIITILVLAVLIFNLQDFFNYAYDDLPIYKYIILTISLKAFVVFCWLKTYFVVELRLKYIENKKNKEGNYENFSNVNGM